MRTAGSRSPSISVKFNGSAKQDHALLSSPKAQQEALAALLEAWNLPPGRPAWRRAAAVLGMRARGEPYRPTYIVSIWNGRYAGGKRLQEALLAELAKLDGASPRLTDMRESRVWSRNGAIAGAQVDQLVRICRDCQDPFVPNTPNRIRCYLCSPAKADRS